MILKYFYLTSLIFFTFFLSAQVTTSYCVVFEYDDKGNRISRELSNCEDLGDFKQKEDSVKNTFLQETTLLDSTNEFNIVEGDTSVIQSLKLTDGVKTVEEESINNYLSIYPNPVEHELKIKISSDEEFKLQYKIYSVSDGKYLTRKRPVTKLAVDVSNFSTGNYFIEIYDSESELIKRLQFVKI